MGYCYNGYFGGFSGVLPPYGPNQVSWPLVYDQSVSIVQQIAYLMGAVNTLHDEQDNWATVDDLKRLLDHFNADQEAQTAALQAYADGQDAKLYARMLKLIEEMEKSALVWDVTQGVFTDSVTAMRNLYTWVSVHAITVDELAASSVVPTVADLAGQTLNVRGLATWSTELKDGWTEPAGIRTEAN